MRYFVAKVDPATALNLAPIGDQQNAKEQSPKLKYSWMACILIRSAKKRYVLARNQEHTYKYQRYIEST